MERTKIYKSGRVGKQFRKNGAHKSGPGRFSLPRVDGSRVLRATLIFFALFAVLVAADTWANSGEVYRGVEVAGTSVGAKTPEEARTLVEKRLAEDVPENITLTGAGEDVALSGEQLGISFDPNSTLERAYAVGRTGGIGKRLSQRIAATFGGVGVGADVNYKTGVVKDTVDSLAQGVNREPGNATLLLSGTTAEAQPGAEGYRLDRQKTMRNVRDAISDLKNKATVAGSTVEPDISTKEAEQAANKVNTALEQPLHFELDDKSWTLEPEQVVQTLSATNGDSDIKLGVDQGQLAALLPDMFSEAQTEPKDAGFNFVNGSVEVEPGPARQATRREQADRSPQREPVRRKTTTFRYR